MTPIAWYQIVLMIFLLGIGIFLNLVAYQWMQMGSRRHQVMSIVE